MESVDKRETAADDHDTEPQIEETKAVERESC